MRRIILTHMLTFLLFGMTCSLARSQTVFEPRGVSLGASATLAGDVRGIFANPASLSGMDLWEGEIASTIPSQGSGFQFEGITAGRRILDALAVNFEYSPGAELDFVFPSSVRIRGLEFATGRTVTYKELLAGSLAVTFNPSLSAGLTIRSRTVTVSDPQLDLQDTTIVTVTNEAHRTSILFDLGLRWEASEFAAFSLVGRGIPMVPGSSLPAEFSSYEFPRQSGLEAGIVITPSPSVGITLIGGTLRMGSFGVEWHPIPSVTLGGATFLDADQSPAVIAGAVSAGWSIGPVAMEASYLKFVNQTNRGNNIVASGIPGSSIRAVEMCPYSPDRLSFGLKVAIGSERIPQVRILGVELNGAIFPAACRTLAYRPLGRVHVKNVSQGSVQVRASFFIDKLMDGPTESRPVTIESDKEMDLPLLAVFNESVHDATAMTVHDGTVTVSVSPTDEADDRTQTRVVVRGRNDWDGNVETLRYFVRPEDPEVLRVTRDILANAIDSLSGVPGPLQLFRKVRVLCNAFAGKLVYVNDPRESADFVQYPDETLHLRGGDCDDMAVCFASLLGSIGVGTAFVDVVPPDNPDSSHVYLMFDTGLAPEFASHIAENSKRYVLRRDQKGNETVWIPIETTAIMKGFDEAWTFGAKQFYNDTKVRSGLVDGWVKVVDLQ